MKINGIIVAFALVIPLLAGSLLYTNSQANIDEARSVFETIGCTGCHTAGGTAPTFDNVVSMIANWSSKYNTIDDAVRNEVNYFGGQKFNSYEEMMKVMAGNVGKTLDDPDIQLLSQFFKDVFQGKVEAPQPSQATTPGNMGGLGEGRGGAPGVGMFYGTVIVGVLLAIILFVAFSKPFK